MSDIQHKETDEIVCPHCGAGNDPVEYYKKEGVIHYWVIDNGPYWVRFKGNEKFRAGYYNSGFWDIPFVDGPVTSYDIYEIRSKIKVPTS